MGEPENLVPTLIISKYETGVLCIFSKTVEISEATDRQKYYSSTVQHVSIDYQMIQLLPVFNNHVVQATNKHSSLSHLGSSSSLWNESF
jgi:hypothetical protein